MGILSWEQVAAVALKGGWPPGPAVIAVAITQPESGRDAAIVQAGQPYATTGWGLWQITPGNSVPQFGINGQLLNPLNNAKAGHFKWAAAGGFSPWTTWANGLELPYMAAAQAAVQHVSHLPAGQLAALVAAAQLAAPGAVGGGGQVSDWSPMVSKSASHARRIAERSYLTGRAAAALRPGAVHPVVQVPSPASVLWVPGRPLPS